MLNCRCLGYAPESAVICECKDIISFPVHFRNCWALLIAKWWIPDWLLIYLLGSLSLSKDNWLLEMYVHAICKGLDGLCKCMEHCSTLWSLENKSRHTKYVQMPGNLVVCENMWGPAVYADAQAFTVPIASSPLRSIPGFVVNYLFIRHTKYFLYIASKNRV